MEKAIELVRVKLEKVHNSHGVEHAIAVLSHIDASFSCLKKQFKEKEAIRLAALLHDLDDRKFFPQNKNFENARQIIKEVMPEKEEIIIEMISLVSFSSNGNNKNAEEWKLYPRYADRLESIGKIGVKRCCEYGSDISRPFFDKKTERCIFKEDLNSERFKERFRNYVGKKGEIGMSSTIDHFYDKIIHIYPLGSNNKYFLQESEVRHNQVVKFVLHFGRTGEIDIPSLF